jgi:capsular exopolysaccharide synthesis family protein
MYTITDDIDGAPVFAVTSSSEDTGKSMVIANLAISFSQLDKKVLLIDSDMRCPVLHDYFGYDDKQAGLSDYISGIANDVIIRGVRENLDLITSGRIPPNPSELLSSPRFTACLKKWKKEYDLIFIDFPPIGIVTDSVTNCKSITGYIFTIRSGRSTAKKINSSIEAMERLGAKIVGIVFVDVKMIWFELTDDGDVRGFL